MRASSKKVFVKICGLCSEADVRAVAALEPDAMGFVLWPGSRRFVPAEQIAEWTPALPSSILKVGVFVDASADEIVRAAGIAGLDTVQLCFFQTLEKIPENFPNLGKNGRKFSKVWKTVRLALGTPPPDEREAVDAYLVDRYSQRSPGGTGEVCDWAVAREFVARSKKPVLLAGGLTPGNVAAAIAQVRPWGVDVSSGVEASPGRKDLEKVRAFIEQCRNV